MRKILALLFGFVLWSQAGFCAVAFVQASTVKQTAATASPTVNLNAPTIGNFIVVGATNYFNSPGRTISSITDTAGNTYAEAKAQAGYSGDSNKSRTLIWYAQVTATANPNVITVNFSGTCDSAFQAVEYSGVAASSQLDTTNGGEGRSTTPSAGAVTAATAGSLYVAVLGDNGDSTSTITPNASWTERGEVEGGGVNVHFSYLDFITSGAQTGSWTYVSTQDDWAAATAIFKIASTTSIKTINGLVKASVKTVKDLAIASVKTAKGLS